MSTALPSPEARSADRGLTGLAVLAKEAVSDDTVALTLAAPDGGRLPDWAPGAHLDLHRGRGGSGSTRCAATAGTPWPTGSQ